MSASSADASGWASDGDSTPAGRVVVEREQRFDEPGTHFLAGRVSAQATGDATDVHARVRTSFARG